MRKFFYNLSSLTAVTVLFALSPMVATAEVTVPAVGSTWVSTMEYKALPSSSSEGGGVSSKRPEEVMTVVRHEGGVPVFASEVFGYKGEIIETAGGTVIYTEKCKDSVPKEILIAPIKPNQCGWHVCNAPAEGVTVTRNITVFAELYSCAPKVGTYTFTSVNKGEVNGEVATVGDAEVNFGLFQKTKWESSISAGRGEVYAKSSARETVYSKVEVSQVPFVNTNKVTAPAAVIEFAKAEEKSQCDVVAFGDSLTRGVGVSQSENYPSILSKLIGKEICNMGIGGNTSSVAKERLSQILALKPRVVFMGIGANDLLQGVSPADTKSNIEVIVDTLTKADVMVVVLGFEGLKTSMTKEMTASLASVKVAVGSNQDIVYLPYAFAGVLDDKSMLSSDNMHPNADGYKKLAQHVHDEAFGALQILPAFVVNQ